MFGLGAKKDKQPAVANPEAEQIKTPVYNVNDEVVFHVMPTRFKKQNADAAQAQKTGLVIIVVAFALIMALAAVMIWYFLVYNKKTVASNSVTNTQTEATTSEPVLIQSTVVPEITEAEVTAPEVSTSSTEVASSSEAIVSSTTENINQAPLVLASSTDSDNDGLTDAEEMILQTNKDKSDTDSDGYSDLAEFEKGYNPVGAGKLSAKVFGGFQNNNFSLSYPASWQFTTSGNDSVIFRTGDEQMVQISLQPNLTNQSIVGWYKEQFGNQEIASNQYINQVDTTGNAVWQGIFSPNRLTVYLTNDKKQTIASINYDPSFSGKLNYQEIFLFMVNSFVLKN